MGELLNASIMFFAPLIINRIGGKNALLLAGTIMSVRIIGSSFATSALEVVILKRCICLKYRSCWWAALNILPASLKCVFSDDLSGLFLLL